MLEEVVEAMGDDTSVVHVPLQHLVQHLRKQEAAEVALWGIVSLWWSAIGVGSDSGEVSLR